jgi:hypothetical protein
MEPDVFHGHAINASSGPDEAALESCAGAWWRAAEDLPQSVLSDWTLALAWLLRESS